MLPLKYGYVKRRNFVKSTGAAITGKSLAGCPTSTDSNNTTESVDDNDSTDNVEELENLLEINVGRESVVNQRGETSLGLDIDENQSTNEEEIERLREIQPEIDLLVDSVGDPSSLEYVKELHHRTWPRQKMDFDYSTFNSEPDGKKAAAWINRLSTSWLHFDDTSEEMNNYAGPNSAVIPKTIDEHTQHSVETFRIDIFDSSIEKDHSPYLDDETVFPLVIGYDSDEDKFFAADPYLLSPVTDIQGELESMKPRIENFESDGRPVGNPGSKVENNYRNTYWLDEAAFVPEKTDIEAMERVEKIVEEELEAAEEEDREPEVESPDEWSPYDDVANHFAVEEMWAPLRYDGEEPSVEGLSHKEAVRYTLNMYRSMSDNRVTEEVMPADKDFNLWVDKDYLSDLNDELFSRDESSLSYQDIRDSGTVIDLLAESDESYVVAGEPDNPEFYTEDASDEFDNLIKV